MENGGYGHEEVKHLLVVNRIDLIAAAYTGLVLKSILLLARCSYR